MGYCVRAQSIQWLLQLQFPSTENICPTESMIGLDIDIKCSNGPELSYLGYVGLTLTFPEGISATPEHCILALAVVGTENNIRVQVVRGTNVIRFGKEAYEAACP